MAFRLLACLWAGISIIALLCGIVMADPSIPLAYCATTNTADMPAFNSIYQSMGRCRDNCTTRAFPLAILQDKNCWCSDLIPNPSDQKPLRNCQNPCPGYPDDYCGGSGTFGYLELNRNGLGTASPGATNTKTSSSAVVKTETETETVQRTVQSTVILPPPVVGQPRTSSVEHYTTSADDDGVSATPGPTVHTVTVSGVIKTVTTTPTPTGDGSAALATSEQSKGLSTGATVGIAIGVVGIVVVAGIFLFMYYMKRKRRDAEDGLFTASRRGSSPGMLSTPKTGEVSENRFADIPNPGPVWDVSSANSKRRSHLMPVDPRLDPFAKGIYVRDQNKSHDSIGSLQDNHDYSRRIQEPPRVLRAVNPDPDD